MSSINLSSPNAESTAREKLKITINLLAALVEITGTFKNTNASKKGVWKENKIAVNAVIAKNQTVFDLFLNRA